MIFEVCYFCRKPFASHECYPLFGKYYICRECQKLVTDAIRELIKVNRDET